MFTNQSQIMHWCATGSQYFLPIVAQYQVGDMTVGLTSRCSGCGQHQVQHYCAQTRSVAVLPVVRQAPPSWFPLVKATVTATCPACGWVADLADTVANDPEATASEQEAARAFRDGALAVGGLLLAVGLVGALTKGEGSAS